MQFQDGRQKYIYNANISATNGPIDFISTPTCTISITTYHLDHVTSIRINDVIMKFQDGRQKAFTMLISQEPTFQSTSFQRLLYYIDYNLSLGSRYKDKYWWRHHAIPRWLPRNIYNAYISGTNVPIDVISTPAVQYRLQPMTWITL